MPFKTIYGPEFCCLDCGRTRDEVKTAFALGLCKVCYEKKKRRTNPRVKELHRLKTARSRLKPDYKKKHAAYALRRLKTDKGYLENCYGRMRRRVEGRTQHPQKHIWKGLPICTRKEFYDWASQNSDFPKLRNRSKRYPHNPKLWVSVDRIDHAQGYVIGNIRFVTHSENSKKKKARETKL